MGFSDYLNPFKALREARSANQSLAQKADDLHHRLNEAARSVRQLESDMVGKNTRIRMQKDEIIRLGTLLEKTRQALPQQHMQQGQE
jgi:hypothetical protein